MSRHNDVRTRRSAATRNRHGCTARDLELPEEAVTRWKLRRMMLGLQTFAMHNDMLERHWRLDLVDVELDLDGSLLRCEHLRDVYPA